MSLHRIFLTRCFGLSGALFAPRVLAAREAPTHYDLATTVGSLMLVLLVIVALMVALKKMRVPSLMGHKDLSVVRQIPVGTKERVAIIQAGEEQYLVGITAQNINLLSKLEQPIIEENAPDSKFSSQLSKLLNKNHHA